jgi:hypothetical protein
VSSSEPKRGDWERIVSTWFDNREADIGGFVRRHLAGADLGSLVSVLGVAAPAPAPSLLEQVSSVLDFGWNRFNEVRQDRGVKIPEVGFREAAVLIDGEMPEAPELRDFLQRLFVTQPRLSGWAPWIDLRNARDDTLHPYVYEGGWEAYVDCLGQRVVMSEHLDFWRADPKGLFYNLRTLQVDLLSSPDGPQPLTMLDPRLEIRQVTEVIAVGLSFARAMGCDESNTSLMFGFRWRKLKGRRLTPWTSRWWPHSPSRGRAAQDTLTTAVSIPVDTPQSGLSPHVHNAIKNLFLLFGEDYGEETTAHFVNELLSGKE